MLTGNSRSTSSIYSPIVPRCVVPQKVTDLSKDKEKTKVLSDYLSLSKIEKEEVEADKTGKILRWLKLAQKASVNSEKEDESSAA